VDYSWLGILPGAVLYVYLGSLGRLGLEAAASGRVAGARLLLLAVGLAATLLATVLVTRSARKALVEAGV
jgi:uncharacterized membrane protein YdjX (TVP38/TMEM64 family)